MTVMTHIADGKVVEIAISGRFDFSVHREFREAYENAVIDTPNPKYVLNLGSTEYMDSSALGMLLLLREYAGGDKCDIKITRCGPEIKEILDISNFNKLFDIEMSSH
ncbi:MAG: STAS domain-containing protein [Gammaproteobacteria bacterium]|nr:STAS domain-containing protein [Gammaproteobacteria bacterium]